MSELSPINTKAVGLTSIGNPINLIAQLDSLSKLAAGYPLYICLNIARHTCDAQRYKTLVDNFYKIVARYESNFSKIQIIDLTDSHFVTHGSCIDFILHCFEEDAIAVFEEDAFIFDKAFFDEQYSLLQNHHVVMGMNKGAPNNHWFFEKLLNYVSDDIRPGKESIFFVRKDITQLFDWYSFDYLTLDTDVQFKLPFTDTTVTKNRCVGFDTSEFFSFGCIMHPNIRRAFYTEQSYLYWHYYASHRLDEFYQHYSQPQQYCHYFNSALYLFLSYNKSNNKAEYRQLTLKFPEAENFLFHLTTYILQLALLRATKKVYIETLGRAEYDAHRRSLKEVVLYLFRYFGLWRMKHNIKIEKFIKFTYSYIERHHGPVL